MTGAWYPVRLWASRQDGGAPPPLLFVPADKWKMRERQKGKRRKNSITPLAPMPLPSPGPAPYRHFTWAETSQLQWAPGSPSPLGRTLLWKPAQWPARGGICPLSSPSPFPLPSVVLSAGLSTGCIGGRGGPASGSGSLSLYTPSVCRHLGGRTVLGRLKWVHGETLLCGT